MKTELFYSSVVVLLLSLAGCAAPRVADYAAPTGISGQARFDDSTLLVVHDVKGGSDDPRISLLSTSDSEAPVLKPVLVNDWVDANGPASDLESVCAVPGRLNEFILAESGSWQGRPARLFHVIVDTAHSQAKVLGSANLPLEKDNSPGVAGDQVEGLACVSMDDNRLLLILGERGGSAIWPSGVLRWGSLNLVDHTLKFDAVGLGGINVDAPGNWTDPDVKRDISGMYLAPDGRLWLSASEELDDPGTFYSVIYEAGTVTPEATPPIRLHPQLAVWREVAGFKIEGLSAPSSAVPESVLSFGTEDEIYGGVWRGIR